MWEGDERVSYATIGESLGISKQAVAKRAAKEKWQKRMDRAKVAEKAHRAADQAMAARTLPLASSAVNGGREAAPVDALDTKNHDVPVVQEESPDLSAMSPAEQAEHLAVKQRTAIITRHRSEVNALRTNLYKSIKDADFNLGKCAKINAEAMEIIHKAERRAWGIEDEPGGGQMGQIIVDRG